MEEIPRLKKKYRLRIYALHALACRLAVGDGGGGGESLLLRELDDLGEGERGLRAHRGGGHEYDREHVCRAHAAAGVSEEWRGRSAPAACRGEWSHAGHS